MEVRIPLNVVLLGCEILCPVGRMAGRVSPLSRSVPLVFLWMDGWMDERGKRKENRQC